MSSQVITRADVIQAIKKIRSNWENDVDKSLVDVDVSLGIFLLDLTDAFGLDRAETKKALGARLFKEVTQKVNSSNGWFPLVDLLEEQPVQ